MMICMLNDSNIEMMILWILIWQAEISLYVIMFVFNPISSKNFLYINNELWENVNEFTHHYGFVNMSEILLNKNTLR